jgi:hypothetical protein
VLDNIAGVGAVGRAPPQGGPRVHVCGAEGRIAGACAGGGGGVRAMLGGMGVGAGKGVDVGVKEAGICAMLGETSGMGVGAGKEVDVGVKEAGICAMLGETSVGAVIVVPCGGAAKGADVSVVPGVGAVTEADVCVVLGGVGVGAVREGDVSVVPCGGAVKGADVSVLPGVGAVTEADVCVVLGGDAVKKAGVVVSVAAGVCAGWAPSAGRASTFSSVMLATAARSCVSSASRTGRWSLRKWTCCP